MLVLASTTAIYNLRAHESKSQLIPASPQGTILSDDDGWRGLQADRGLTRDKAVLSDASVSPIDHGESRGCQRRRMAPETLAEHPEAAYRL